MAINYTQLFGDLEELVDSITEIESMMTTIDTRMNSIVDSYSTSGVDSLIGNVTNTYQSFINQLESMTDQVTSLMQERLTERETVLEQLPKLTNEGLSSVFQELIKDMIENSETVEKSVVTVTPGTPVKTNANAGVLITTKLLPGDISPGSGISANLNYAGVDSEFTLDDTITLECISDNQQGGTAGTERFRISGIVPGQTRPFQFNAGGNQGTGSISVSESVNQIRNFFENFTSDLPNGWTASNGTAGTDFSEETTDVHIGSSALLIDGAGAMDLRYDITNLITPGQVFCLYFYLKRASAVAGTLDVDVVINGSSVVNETITVDSTYDNYALWNNVFVVPDVIGSDSYVKLAADPPGVDLLIDGGGMVPMNYFAGLGFAIIADEDPFIVGDNFPVTVANDDAGVINRVFTRAFGIQLPSAASGAETLSTT